VQVHQADAAASEKLHQWRSPVNPVSAPALLEQCTPETYCEPRMISGGPRIGFYRRFNLRDPCLRGSTAMINQHPCSSAVPVTDRQVAIQLHFIAAAPADYFIAVVARFTGTLIDDPRMNHHLAFPAISRCDVHLHNRLTGVTLRI